MGAVGHASVANVLLSLSLKGAGGTAAAARAAQEVARSAARTLLLPLLDRLIARLAAVLLRTWHIAVDHAAPQGGASSWGVNWSELFSSRFRDHRREFAKTPPRAHPGPTVAPALADLSPSFDCVERQSRIGRNLPNPRQAEITVVSVMRQCRVEPWSSWHLAEMM